MGMLLQQGGEWGPCKLRAGPVTPGRGQGEVPGRGRDSVAGGFMEVLRRWSCSGGSISGEQPSG